FHFTDGRTVVKRVVAHSLDSVENGEATAAEHFNVDAETSIDHLCQWHTLIEQKARAGDQVFHQRHIILAEVPRDDVLLADAVVRGNIERDVDAALVEVARNVLPEICELEGRTRGIGKALALFVAIATEVEN